ncbi:MAG: hypothetical protein WAR76_14660 [Xanthobacteraceae bacterium]
MRDHNGQALAYVYFEDERGRRSAAKLLERDEARRIALKMEGAFGLSSTDVIWAEGDMYYFGRRTRQFR